MDYEFSVEVEFVSLEISHRSLLVIKQYLPKQIGGGIWSARGLPAGYGERDGEFLVYHTFMPFQFLIFKI